MTWSATELESAIRGIRAGSKKFLTNFFAPPAAWPAWIQRGLQVLARSERFLLMTRAEERCTRLFFAADQSCLGEMLAAACKRAGTDPLVADLVGQSRALGELVQTFSDGGFEKYLRLLRLSRIGAFPFDGNASNELQTGAAALDDSATILNLLREQFDIYTDQLPGEDEIRDVIPTGSILGCRHSGQLVGFLWLETTGVTSMVRYWCADPRSGARGVGGALMREYFERTKASARHLLWVRENNARALACYRHYGYQTDGLEDQLMVKR